MGSDKSRDHYQGLLIEDPRVDIWTAETTATQSGPRPGVPQPLNQTGMTLQASGAQSADKDLRIRTQRGGFSEPDGAGFVWRYAADTLWRGHDVPGAISHYECLKWTDLTVPVKWYIQPHCITLQDHSMLVAFHERDDSLAEPYCVTVGREPSGAWAYTRVYQTATPPVVGKGEPNPCLLVLPSGRVLLFHWIMDVVREETQIRMWFSDDDGATWAIGQDNVLDNPVDVSAAASGYGTRRIRAAYGSGQILLLVHLVSQNPAYDSRDVVRQYASSDDGNSFDSIEEWDGLSTGRAGGFPDLVFSGDHFVVGYISVEPTSNAQAKGFRLGNAYQPTTSVPHDLIALGPAFGEYAAPYIIQGDLAMATTPSGPIYVTGRAVPNSTFSAYDEDGECVMFRSDDFGLTWNAIGQFSGLAGLSGLSGVWYNGNNATTCPRALAMTHSRGRMAVFHNWKASPGVTGTIDEPSLSVSYLGGSSTVTLPGFQRFQTGYRRVNFEDTYLPFDLPAVTPTQWGAGWVSSGAAAETLTDGYLQVGGGAPGVRTYTSTGLPAGHTIEQGIIFHASLSIDAGGSSVTDDVVIRCDLDDGGVNGFAVIVRFGVAEVVFVDGVSSATVGTVPLSAVGAGLDVMVGMVSSGFASWVRPRNSASDRNWIVGPTSAALTNSGGGGSAAIFWGHGFSAATQSRWHTFQMVTGEYTGLQLAGGQINPNELFQHPYAATGTYVDDGVSVHGTDGTTIRADEWQIATRYDYPLSAMLDPNPRRTWRSTTLINQTVGLQLSTLGNTDPLCDCIGLALYNCNWPAAVLQGYDSVAAAWVTIGNILLFQGMSALPFVREADSVRPNGAGANQPLIYAGEFEGALWSFEPAGSGHKIAAQLTGKWSDAATTRPVSLVLDGITGAEPASGANGSISSKDGVFILHLQGARYQGYRLSLTAPGIATPGMADSYFEIGRALIGPVVIHGDRTSWGRVLESSSGTELQEARDRTTRSRKVAPTRRIIEYGFTDGVDTTAGMNPAGDSDPDFVMAAGAATSEAVALKDIAPWDFDGVFHLLAGPDKQVVYIPRVTKQNLGTEEPLVRKHQHALCRITSPIRLESIQGEESADEVLRVATVTFTEDV